MMKKIGIIDYGRGNLRSVAKALEAVGADVKVSDSPKALDSCAGILLPGVGAFGDSMAALKRKGFVSFLKRVAKQGRPLIGVCLGLQLFCESSTEFGNHEGLGFFKGKVQRFEPGLKIPHMGWNQVRVKREDCPLFKGIPEDSEFYFVHSYRLASKGTAASAGQSGSALAGHDSPASAGQTCYGKEVFDSVLWDSNVFATQFHPEKSQKAGLKLYANYWKLVRSAKF